MNALEKENPAGAGSAKEETAAPILAQDEDGAKTISSWQAKFALSGHAVYELSGGGFLVTRWGLSKVCPDLAALRAFARQLGVRG